MRDNSFSSLPLAHQKNWPRMHFIPYPRNLPCPCTVGYQFYHPAEARSLLRSLNPPTNSHGQPALPTSTSLEPLSARLILLPTEILAFIIGYLNDNDLICLGSTCSKLFGFALETINAETLPPSPPAWAGQPIFCANSKAKALAQIPPVSQTSDSDSTPSTDSSDLSWLVHPIYYSDRHVNSMWFNAPRNSWSTEFAAFVGGMVPPQRPELNYWARTVGALQGGYHPDHQWHWSQISMDKNTRVYANEPGLRLFRRCFGGSAKCVNAKQIWLLRCLDRKEFITCCSCREFKKHVKPMSAFLAQPAQRTTNADKISVNDIVCIQTRYGEERAINQARGKWTGCRLDIMTVDAHQKELEEGTVRGEELDTWTDITEQALAEANAKKVEAAAWNQDVFDGEDPRAFPGCGCFYCRIVS